jgi:hypothetical protein
MVRELRQVDDPDEVTDELGARPVVRTKTGKLMSGTWLAYPVNQGAKRGVTKSNKNKRRKK